MLVRVLELLVTLFVARAIWRFLQGVMEGLSGPKATPRGGVPSRGVQMVRDPVCGTFVVPGSALSIAEGRGYVFFCSAACRDKYRARSA